MYRILHTISKSLLEIRDGKTKIARSIKSIIFSNLDIPFNSSVISVDGEYILNILYKNLYPYYIVPNL